MGLDMYLTKKRFLWHEEREKLVISGIEGIDAKKVQRLEMEAHYWRKVNAVHAWFVENVQDGKDDCGEYMVTREDFKKLLDVISKAIETVNPDLIPPQAGFFFGSTEVDEYYWKDLRETAEVIEAILKEDDFNKCDYYYSSSW